LAGLTKEQAEQFAAGTCSELEILGLEIEEVKKRAPDKAEVLARLEKRIKWNENQEDRNAEVRGYLRQVHFKQRMAQLEDAVREKDDPAGWLLAQHHEAFRRKQKKELWPLVDAFCQDGELDWGEYTRLMAKALDLELTSTDVDVLIDEYAELLKERGKELVVEREPDIRWPSFRKFKKEGSIRSLDHFRSALLKNRSTASDLLREGLISEWFEQVQDDVDEEMQGQLKSAGLSAKEAKGVDVYLNRIRSALKAAQRAERSKGGERAVWRLLWDLGYKRIHLGNKHIRSVEELVQYCDGDASKIKKVLGAGQLADWCEVIAEDEALSGEAARLKSLADTTGPRDWLWAAGEDRFTLAPNKVYTDPAELAQDLSTARNLSEKLEQALEDGSVKTWVSALVARESAKPVQLKSIDAANMKTGTRRAWMLAFLWGLKKLPLFKTNGSPLEEIGNKAAILQARKKQPDALISAIRSGAFFAWVDTYVPDVEDLEEQVRLIYTLPEAVLPHAACWLLGEPTLVSGSESLSTLEDAFDLFERNPDRLGKLYKSGELTTWLWMALDRSQNDVEEAMEVAKNFREEDELAAFLQAWGYTGLRLNSSTIVKSPDQFLEHADENLERVEEVIDSGLLVVWLTLWPNHSGAVEEALKRLGPLGQATHKVEDILVAMGAEQPELVVEPASLELHNLEEGQYKQFDLDISAAGHRGYLHGDVRLEHDMLQCSSGALNYVQQHGASAHHLNLAVQTPLGKRLTNEQMDISIASSRLTNGVATVPVMVSTNFPMMGIIKTFVGLVALVMAFLLGIRLIGSFLFAPEAASLFKEDGLLIAGAIAEFSQAPWYHFVAFILLGCLGFLHLAKPWVPVPAGEKGRYQDLLSQYGFVPLALVCLTVSVGLWFLFCGITQTTYGLATMNASYIAFGDAYASGLTRVMYGEATSGMATATSWILLTISLGVTYSGWETFRKYNRTGKAIGTCVIGLIMLFGFSSFGTSLGTYGDLSSELDSMSQSNLSERFADPVLGDRARVLYYTRGLKEAIENGQNCDKIPEMIKQGGLLPEPFNGPWDAQGGCAYKAKDAKLMTSAYNQVLRQLDVDRKKAPSAQVVKTYKVIIQNFKDAELPHTAGMWLYALAQRMDGHSTEFEVLDHYFFAGKHMFRADKATGTKSFNRFMELVGQHKKLSRSAKIKYYLIMGEELTQKDPGLAKQAFRKALKLDANKVMSSGEFKVYLDFMNSKK